MLSVNSRTGLALARAVTLCQDHLHRCLQNANNGAPGGGQVRARTFSFPAFTSACFLRSATDGSAMIALVSSEALRRSRGKVARSTHAVFREQLDCALSRALAVRYEHKRSELELKH